MRKLTYSKGMLREKELTDVRQTAKEMYRIAFAWKEDMAEYATLSLQELFDLIKDIPWAADPPDTEFIQRPWYTMHQASKYGDCDDKAVCVGAWCNLLGIPFRFVAVSKDKNLPLHHVLTEMYIQGAWFNFDPTYSFNVLGRPGKEYPQRLILKP